MSAEDELESLGFIKITSRAGYEEWVRIGSIWDCKIVFTVHGGKQYSKILCQEQMQSPVYVTADAYEAMIHRMRERDAE